MAPCMRILLTLLGLALPGLAGATPVLLIGDSITNGQVGGPAGPGYAERLVPLLGPDYTVTTAAASGSSAVLWDPEALACGGLCPETPDDTFYNRLAEANVQGAIVSILLGTNDSNGFFLPEPTPTAAYRSAMESLIDTVLADEARAVVVMTAPMRPEAPLALNARLLAYREEVLDVCSGREGVFCGPDLFGLLAPGRDFAGDDIHPNLAGHQRIAEALAESVLAIPEPASGPLLALGLAALTRRTAPRRRRPSTSR